MWCLLGAGPREASLQVAQLWSHLWALVCFLGHPDLCFAPYVGYKDSNIGKLAVQEA